MERDREKWKINERHLHNEITRLRQVGERDMINMERKQEADLAVLFQVAANDTSPNSSIPGNQILQLIPSMRQSNRHHQQHRRRDDSSQNR